MFSINIFRIEREAGVEGKIKVISRNVWITGVALTSGLVSVTGGAGEGMAQMPLLKENRVIVVTDDDDFDASRGFGEGESSVRMMNLMMVEGSGFEGMDMGEMSMPTQSSKKSK